MTGWLLAVGEDGGAQSSHDAVLIALITSAFTFLGLAVAGYWAYKAQQVGKENAQAIATNHGKRPGEHLETIYEVAEGLAEVKAQSLDTQNTQDVLRREMDEIRIDLRTIIRHLIGTPDEPLELPPTRVCRRRRCIGDCGGIHNVPPK